MLWDESILDVQENNNFENWVNCGIPPNSYWMGVSMSESSIDKSIKALQSYNTNSQNKILRVRGFFRGRHLVVVDKTDLNKPWGKILKFFGFFNLTAVLKEVEKVKTKNSEVVNLFVEKLGARVGGDKSKKNTRLQSVWDRFLEKNQDVKKSGEQSTSQKHGDAQPRGTSSATQNQEQIPKKTGDTLGTKEDVTVNTEDNKQENLGNIIKSKEEKVKGLPIPPQNQQTQEGEHVGEISVKNSNVGSEQKIVEEPSTKEEYIDLDFFDVKGDEPTKEQMLAAHNEVKKIVNLKVSQQQIEEWKNKLVLEGKLDILNKDLNLRYMSNEQNEKYEGALNGSPVWMVFNREVAARIFACMSKEEKARVVSKRIEALLPKPFNTQDPQYTGLCEYLRKKITSDAEKGRLLQPISPNTIYQMYYLVSRVEKEFGGKYECIPAIDNGDCFYDAVAQGITSATGGFATVDSVKEEIIEYAKSGTDTQWVESVKKDTAHYGDYEQYKSKMGMKLNVVDTIGVWGRPKIEGAVLSRNHNISLHVFQAQRNLEIPKDFPEFLSKYPQSIQIELLAILQPDNEANRREIFQALYVLEEHIYKNKSVPEGVVKKLILEVKNQVEKGQDVRITSESLELQNLQKLFKQKMQNRYTEKMNVIYGDLELVFDKYSGDPAQIAQNLERVMSDPSQWYHDPEHEVVTAGGTQEKRKNVYIGLYPDHFIAIVPKSEPKSSF